VQAIKGVRNCSDDLAGSNIGTTLLFLGISKHGGQPWRQT
jgi:hypothetical protein